MKISVYNKETNMRVRENLEVTTEVLKELFDTYPHREFSFEINGTLMSRTEAGNLQRCAENHDYLPGDWVAVWECVYETHGTALDWDEYKVSISGPFDTIEEADGEGEDEIMSDYDYDVLTIGGYYYAYFA